MDMYLSNNIDESTFCDEFYYSYDLELDRSTLTEDERKAFLELGEIVGRFSEFEEDHKNHPGVYYTKKELKKKILEVKNKLKSQLQNSSMRKKR